MANNLSKLEIQAVENYVLDGMTDAAIAKELGRNEQTIKRCRDKLGLKKGGGGKLHPDAETISDENLNSIKVSDDDKRLTWAAKFKLTSRYKKIKNALNDYEIEHFVSQWADYHVQFNDMQPSEEDMLEQLIMLQIRLDDNHRQRRQLQIYEEHLKEQFVDKLDGELDLENEDDRRLHEMLMSNSRQGIDLNKDLKDLTEKYEKFQRAFAGTREQREQNNKVGGETFMTLLRDFNKREFRIKMGKANEYMKIAQKQQAEKMRKPHKFIDGSEEPILLDGNNFIKKKGDINVDSESKTNISKENGPISS